MSVAASRSELTPPEGVPVPGRKRKSMGVESVSGSSCTLAALGTCATEALSHAAARFAHESLAAEASAQRAGDQKRPRP